MAITEYVLVEIASVDVNDECRIEVKQHRRSTDYTPDQAEALAEELLRHAARARALEQEVIEETTSRICAQREDRF